jgi:phosphate transport system substrate-binding protein
LEQWLSHHSADGAHKLILVGFTDSDGNASQNEKLSRNRAGEVAQMLNERGITPAVNGFGQECPIASNRTEVGKSLNRRVEVWLRKAL